MDFFWSSSNMISYKFLFVAELLYPDGVLSVDYRLEIRALSIFGEYLFGNIPWLGPWFE